MIEHEELSELFQILQQSGLNCGGIWKVRTIKKSLEDQDVINTLINEFSKSPKYDNLDKYIEYQKPGGWNPEEQRLTKNIELNFIENWEPYLSERIDFWSNFELISKDEMLKLYNDEIYKSNKQEFLDKLKCFLPEEIKMFKMNESTFDTYDLFWHQIQEDILFDLKNEVIALNFGWSS